MRKIVGLAAALLSTVAAWALTSVADSIVAGYWEYCCYWTPFTGMIWLMSGYFLLWQIIIALPCITLLPPVRKRRDLVTYRARPDKSPAQSLPGHR
jgi:hypothetical protein